MRCFERAIRRANLPIAHSHGFSPRPKIAFPLPLAVGIEGRNEVVDLDLETPSEPSLVQARLGAHLPPGLQLVSAQPAPPGRASQASAATYELSIPAELREAARAALARFLSATEWIYQRHRPGKTSAFDLRPMVASARISDDNVLTFTLRVDPRGSARPEEFLEAVELASLPSEGTILARTHTTLIDHPANPTTPGDSAPDPSQAVSNSLEFSLET